MKRRLAPIALGLTLATALAYGADAPAPHPPAPAAAAAPMRFALAWARDEGAETCPAGRDFAEEVTRRLGHSPFDDGADRTIEIHVTRDGGTFASRVYVRERSGQVLGQRALSSGEDCAVLFNATVLAVALLIEPDAVLTPVASHAVAQFELPAPPPPAPTPAAPSNAPGPPPPAPAAIDVATKRPARDELGTVALHSVLAVGVVPLAEPGVELTAGASLGHRFRVNAQAAYVAPGRASHTGTTFLVGLTAFGLGAGFDFVNDGAVAAGAEVGGWVGALNASFRATSDPAVTPTDGGDFVYVAGSAGLDLRIRITRAAFAEARALALVPFVRRELQLAVGAGSESVWQQRAIGGMGAAGLGVAFF